MATNTNSDAKTALVDEATAIFRDFAKARASGRLGVVVELDSDFVFHALLMALKSAYKFNIALPQVLISDARENTPMKAEEHRVWASVIPGWSAMDTCSASPPTSHNGYDQSMFASSPEAESTRLRHQADRVAEEIAMYKRENPNPYPLNPGPQPMLAR